MATGRQNKLTGQLAEHLVCAELGRRGLIATPFSGNVPTFDNRRRGCGGVADWLRTSGYMQSADETERLIAKRGSFHVTRTTCFMHHGIDSWSGKQSELATEIRELETNPGKLADLIPKAFRLLIETVKALAAHVADVDKALKSSALDRDIDRRLHSKPPAHLVP